MLLGLESPFDKSFLGFVWSNAKKCVQDLSPFVRLKAESLEVCWTLL
jgi:hypothetical protein